MRIEDVKKVCIVGAGTMGSQIALHTALYGYQVALTDTAPEVLQKARDWAAEYLASRVAKGKMTGEKAEEAKAAIVFAADLETAARDADVVIEAVVEKLDVKRQLFAALDSICPARTILASNSSTIVSSKIADATNRPAKVLNMHYFNPALVMELVEVVQGPHTSEESAQLIMELSRRTGKIPILLKKEISGFVANRILGAVVREACSLLEQGIANHEEIDLAVEKALRYPLGPFRLMDLNGIDVSYLVRAQRFSETGLEEDRPPRVIEEKYKKGEWGKKTGKGFYDYT
ncbi:MAG: 3-hydroxyacyl-CoA dehydrogenase family protein [Syntrophomonadaceae bacterium]|jgi:3-hydroxybutyryl-CoA dehydrogenase|nr:3-hydroxyacyl-CoA dehydrogenase family protein [Syntrophomonadaceae bacterium]